MIRVSFQKNIKATPTLLARKVSIQMFIYIMLKIQVKFPLPKFSQNEVDTSLL